MTDSFIRRMADLDAMVEQCRGKGVFAVGTVRDTSNRSNRDWPWWGIEVEQTKDDGLEKRRRTAEVILNAPAPGVPAVFKGRWRARIWQGVSADSFTEQGDRSFAWATPSAKELRDALGSLLDEAEEALNRADPLKS